MLKSLHIRCKETLTLFLESRGVSPSHTSLSQNQSRCQASGDQSLERTCRDAQCRQCSQDGATDQNVACLVCLACLADAQICSPVLRRQAADPFTPATGAASCRENWIRWVRFWSKFCIYIYIIILKMLIGKLKCFSFNAKPKQKLHRGQVIKIQDVVILLPHCPCYYRLVPAVKRSQKSVSNLWQQCFPMATSSH